MQATVKVETPQKVTSEGLTMFFLRIMLFLSLIGLVGLDLVLYLTYEYHVATSWPWDMVFSFMQLIYPGVLLVTIIAQTTNTNFLSLVVVVSFITLIFECIGYFFTIWLAWVWLWTGYTLVFGLKTGLLGTTLLSVFVLWIYLYMGMVQVSQYSWTIINTLPQFREVAKKYKQIILGAWTGVLLIATFLTIMHFLNYFWPLVPSEFALHIHWFLAFIIFPVVEYDYHPLRDGKHYSMLVGTVLTGIGILAVLDTCVVFANLGYMIYLVSVGLFPYSLANVIVFLIQMGGLSIMAVLEIVILIVMVGYSRQIRTFAIHALQPPVTD